MAFETGPLDTLIEIDPGTGWVDVTGDVYLRDDIAIKRGRGDEAAAVDPGTCTLTLNNRDGRYTPKNPISPYYGQIGRNTPLRVSVLEGSGYLYVPGSGSRAATPDAAVLDITGDIDVRIEVSLEDWDPDEAIELAGKYDSTVNQRSWLMLLGGTNNELIFRWSPDGTSALQFGSTEPVPVPASGRIALRSTLDVNNGAGGNTVTHYWSTSIDGPWTQLGDAGISVGVTSIFASTTALEVGDNAGAGAGAFFPPTGRFHAFELRDGIDGTVAANPDFTSQASGTLTFTDGAGRVWTLAGDAEITNRKTRFIGEVSSWPPRWDVSGADVYVPLEASGILRRLGQGASPLNSAMYREMASPARTGIVAYWPMEDGENATEFGSALPGHTAMRVLSGTPDPAAFSDYAPSGALPTIQDAHLSGTVPSYTSTGMTALRVFLQLPDGGVASTQRLITLTGVGTAPTWSIWVDAAGDLDLRAYDGDGTQIMSTGFGAYFGNGTPVSLGLELTQDGADIDWVIVEFNVPTSTLTAADGLTTAGTLAGRTFGRATGVRIGQDRDLGDTVLGHCAVGDGTGVFADTNGAIIGWSGETARDRIVRLCREEGISLLAALDGQDSALVGPQRVATILDLLQDAADADQGLLYEQREAIGLAYRPMATFYNQAVTLALDYESGREVSPPLEPVDDDQAIRNDVTVARMGGASARVVRETGPLSVQAPPDGVGRYDESLTLNVFTDAQPEQIAAWLVYLGTQDDTRYPVVHVRLHGAPHLLEAAVAADVRDRAQIANPPQWLPPDVIDLFVEGYSETLSLFEWHLWFNCSPARPWDIGVADDDVVGRADTEGSELAVAVDADDASLAVATTSGPVWVTDSGEYPFDLAMGGEVVTATAGTSSIVDTFARVVVDGWGTPDVGGAWTNAGGLASNFDVTGTQGTHTMTSVSVSRRSTIPAVTADFDVVVTVSSNDLATGGSQFVGLVARAASVDNLYHARLEFTTTQDIVLTLRKRVGGVETELAALTTSLTHAVSTQYRVRFQGVGSTLRARAWLAADPEPYNWWHVTATDTDLTAAAGIGVRSILSGTNTDVNPIMSYDDFESLNPQTITVTRSVNSVVKSHGAGTDVRLAHPSIVAL